MPNKGNRFRKKLFFFVVSAIRWDGNSETAFRFGFSKVTISAADGSLILGVPPDETRCAIGDWLIRGLHHEIYVCTNEEFGLTYVLVDEEENTLT